MEKIFFLSLIVTAFSLPDEDLVMAPGMVNETVYSGYLDTEVSDRKIHYVFVAGRENAATAPLTIWFNGGPGCSSLIGMLKSIGPYLIGNDYSQGDLLIRNENSWNKISNLLFIQSPAIVGFSTEKDTEYPWTDEQTAKDALSAIKNFIKVKAPEFNMRDLYLMGESYAGKHVPDLAIKILRNNEGEISDYINLKGIMVGNGVMNFKDNSMEKSEYQYLFEHDFITQRLWSVYRHSCLVDFSSPRCRYFKRQMDIYGEDGLNPENVYQLCKTKSSSTLRMKELIRKLGGNNNQASTSNNDEITSLGQIKECPNDNGIIKYWNLNANPFHVAAVKKMWLPCTGLTYNIEKEGSIEQYRQIFLNRGVKVWMYNGDWDQVIPFRDSEKNLENMGMKKIGEWEPWFVGPHHAGFYQQYEKVMLITIKGGSAMAVESQPTRAYQLFYNFVRNRPINTPV